MPRDGHYQLEGLQERMDNHSPLRSHGIPAPRVLDRPLWGKACHIQVGTINPMATILHTWGIHRSSPLPPPQGSREVDPRVALTSPPSPRKVKERGGGGGLIIGAFPSGTIAPLLHTMRIAESLTVEFIDVQSTNQTKLS